MRLSLGVGDSHGVWEGFTDQASRFQEAFFLVKIGPPRGPPLLGPILGV